MAGLTRPTVTQVFNGQSCIIIFDAVDNYDTATVASIVGNGFDVGQVLNGSTEWTGEDASFDNIIDEQGDVIVPNPTAGTYGFDFFMADFSAQKLQTFMKGREISLTGMTDTAFSEADKAIAVGEQLAVIERPIALVNDTSDKAIFFPKARIATSPGLEDALMGLRASTVAQDCNTTNLGTMMYIPKMKLKYNED